MEQMKNIYSKAEKFISDSNPQLWSNAFSTVLLYVILIKNTSKFFNAWFGEENRSFPVLILVRHIIAKFLDIFCKLITKRKKKLTR